MDCFVAIAPRNDDGWLTPSSRHRLLQQRLIQLDVRAAFRLPRKVSIDVLPDDLKAGKHDRALVVEPERPTQIKWIGCQWHLPEADLVAVSHDVVRDLAISEPSTGRYVISDLIDDRARIVAVHAEE